VSEHQLTIFDLVEGKRLRDEALETMEARSPEWIVEARRVAVTVAQRQGTVTANDVRAVLEPLGIFPKHSNSWGSLFRQNIWERTGERVPSRIVTSHASEISVWRLRSEPK